MKKRLIILFFASASFAAAQLPDTDIWLTALKTTATGSASTEKPLNITRRKGYDNQPAFSADGKKILYTTARDDRQTDIFEYHIGSKKTRRVTNTPESEFSPVSPHTPTLAAAVVVEADSAQRIHYINTQTGVHTKTLSIDSVGYFCFLNADSLIYFKTGTPPSLWFYDLATNQQFKLGENPVRGMARENRHTFFYGLKEEHRVVYYRYNLLLRKGQRYAYGPENGEDIFYHPRYGLMRAEGSKILKYDSQKEDWQDLLDLSGSGIRKITRFAIDAAAKHLVLVQLNE